VTTTRGTHDLGPQVHAALTARARAHQLTLNALCVRVGLAPSVATRWKTRGATPSLATYLLLTHELEQLDLDQKEKSS
jgi:hypothetical protein